jgi:DNA-binding transcriptional ArsR family regulator
MQRSNATVQNLDAIFSALSDPTRRAIVSRLAAGDASVIELAAPFDITLPAISRHLKVLERAGLISRGRDAQRRPCQLRASALDAVTAWSRHTRQVWEERLDNLDAYLKQLTAEHKTQTKAHPPTKKQRKKPHAKPR